MASDDAIQLLNTAAHDGHLDYSKWPQLLQTVISRLEDIVKNTFPIPTLPPQSIEPSPFSQSTPQASADHNSTSPSRIPSSQQTEPAVNSINHTTSLSPSSKQLPTSLQIFFESIKKNLTTIFAEKPPYTLQRLAELLLIPDKHYKTLPAFLRAVDRVVSVSSTADIFPLPSIAMDTNGVLGSGSDDFNGAALTRIPWATDERTDWPDDVVEMVGIEGQSSAPDLRTESTALIDGPHGAGSVETVTVTINGIQGDEKLQGTASKDLDQTAQNDVAPKDNEGGDAPESSTEEFPHARGPQEIGMEDMGPQAMSLSSESGPADSIEAAERAVGRPGEAEKVNTHGESDEQLTTDEMTTMADEEAE